MKKKMVKKINSNNIKTIMLFLSKLNVSVKSLNYYRATVERTTVRQKLTLFFKSAYSNYYRIAFALS